MKKVVLALLTLTPLHAAPPVAQDPSAIAATRFLATLDEAQRPKAALPFSSDERENFRYTPRDRAGLPFKEMSGPQVEAAKNLVGSALSEKGKLKVTQIMSLEAVLAEIEKRPEFRDAGKYCVAIFGTPGDPQGWGWRFEGHHISLNFTTVPGKKTSVTPSFLGSNPAEVRQGPLTGLKVLAAEENLARTLLASLQAAELPVIFNESAPAETLSGESRKADALDPVGVPASRMSPVQRDGLLAIIAEYTGRYRKDLADADMQAILDAGIENLHFGWAGGTRPGDPYYYRVQGPTFLLEAANTQNNANHLHAVWRDFAGDFGRDILAEHLRDHP